MEPTPPMEYMEAQMVHRMCEQYQALPDAGGVLDQDISIMRMRAILVAGGYFDDDSDLPSARAQSSDPLAGIPMMAMS